VDVQLIYSYSKTRDIGWIGGHLKEVSEARMLLRSSIVSITSAFGVTLLHTGVWDPMVALNALGCHVLSIYY